MGRPRKDERKIGFRITSNRAFMILFHVSKYNISTAEDGEQGIKMAIQDVPDLIISDLMIPKANGLQLCQQLKEDERTSHIPIILLTGRADSESKLQGYRKGADDYISKPFQYYLIWACLPCSLFLFTP